jgi:Xaa-Pro aminopeptidase
MRFSALIRLVVLVSTAIGSVVSLEHVVDWSELMKFFAARSDQKLPIYFADNFSQFAELPPNLLSTKSPEAPAWLQVILQRWPAFETKEAGEPIQALMAVQSADEIVALRAAAKATVAALLAGSAIVSEFVDSPTSGAA